MKAMAKQLAQKDAPHFLLNLSSELSYGWWVDPGKQLNIHSATLLLPAKQDDGENQKGESEKNAEVKIKTVL